MDERSMILSGKYSPFRARRALTVVFAALAVAATGWFSYRIALDAGIARMNREANERLTLLTSTFDATVERFRFLPTVLALADPIRDLYRRPDDPKAAATANRYLRSLNDAAGSAELFVLDRTGLTLAASNFDRDTSFVGQNYAFRPYFEDAVRSGEGHHYAIGVTTGQPGYFLSHGVAEEANAIGVAVVKVDLGGVESEWMRVGDFVAMVDANDVVFLSSQPQWKYRPLSRLSAAQARLLTETRQYGDIANATPLFATEQNDRGVRIVHMSEPNEKQSNEYAIYSRALPAHGWRLLALSDVGVIRRQAAVIGGAGALAVLVCFLTALAVYQRRQVLRAKLDAHGALEQRVTERTAELTSANTRLSVEIDERIRAERDLRIAQENLVQSAKLASLGQALAGVAHEVNQPLAALNTYVASSRLLLQRNEIGRALSNLDLISSIVERMSALTQHLRMFARKETEGRSATDLCSAITNALRLLDYRIRDEEITMALVLPDLPVYVLGNPIRLEQVVVNLVSNALDAMRGCQTRCLSIDLRSGDRSATIEIADTGQGMVPEHVKSAFDPFFTTKEVGQGLGLGLSISYGLIREAGGDIVIKSETGRGSVFCITLPTTSNVSARDAAEAVA